MRPERVHSGRRTRTQTEARMRAFPTRLGAAAAIVSAVVMLAACAAQPLKQPSWQAPADPMALAVKAGFQPTDREHLVTYTHAHLAHSADAHRLTVPPRIGIDINARIG